jgi:hypothetical protein
MYVNNRISHGILQVEIFFESHFLHTVTSVLASALISYNKNYIF